MNTIGIVLMLLATFGLGYFIGDLRIRRIQKQAVTDTLTGVYNRAWMEKTLGRLIASSVRSKDKLSIMIVDLDNFKKANDTYGHQFGDLVLKSVAGEMVKSIRQSDFIFRYGGDEFVLILPATPSRSAVTLAKKLINNITNLNIETSSRKPYQVVASIGIATAPEHGDSNQTLFAAADEAVYQAKDSAEHIEVKK